MKVVIDGNIGSGKTTQLELLQSQGYTIKKEPLEKWPLDLYYSDPKRWGFLFQIMILQTLQPISDDKVIYERSPLSSRHVFWEVMEKTELEDETYKKQYELQKWEPDAYIFINKSPELCFEHIQNRIQEGDAKVSLEYLKLLHDWYLKMFNKHIKCNRKFIVDGNQSIEEVNKNIFNILKTLYECE
jgi:deoxyadenosine/deoxycytidine kinase